MNDTLQKPACYADLDTVMPVEGENGMRGPNHGCLRCSWLKECLRAAVETPTGRAEREKRIEATSKGLLGRLRMWHERKMLQRKGDT
ncbi:MAG: hypothetical protein V2A77_07470 [Pseudomonadota bacterium]